MAKQNTFFGATLSYTDTISYYYRQGDFSRFIIQAMIENGGKADDDYNIVLWAVDNKGKVMNGSSAIKVPLNNHTLPAKKKVHFANVPLSKEDLNDLYKGDPFDLELRPVFYLDTDYVGFDVYKVNEVTLVALKTLNPSPPA